MSLPRYPKYKDSGVEWLGEVPEHWSITPFRRLLSERLANGLFKKRDQFGAGTLLVNVSDAYRDDFKINFDQLERVECDDEELKSYEVKPGDLFFVRSSLKQEGIAAVVLAGPISEPSVFECHLIRARPNFSALKSRYASYLLNSTVYRSKTVASAKVTTMTTLDQEAILSIVLPIPSGGEQLSIAAFLDRETAKIEALVEEQRRLIQLLKEKRQAVISHAVTKGLNPNAPMKDSGIECLGEVPEHWKVVRLKYLAYVQGGIAKGRDLGAAETIQVPYLRVANVQDGYLDLEEVTLIEILPGELKRYSLQPGDVLMNEGGDFDKLGRGHIWWGEIEPCIHQNHVFAVRPEKLEPEWLNLITSAECGRFYFMSRSKQSTNLASISSSNIQELPVACPPEAERLAIVKHVQLATDSSDQLIAAATRAIDLLQERRTALISAAVTGKIDVRGIAKEQTA